jgi:hypothetical protein
MARRMNKGLGIGKAYRAKPTPSNTNKSKEVSERTKLKNKVKSGEMTAEEANEQMGKDRTKRRDKIKNAALDIKKEK